MTSIDDDFQPIRDALVACSELVEGISNQLNLRLKTREDEIAALRASLSATQQKLAQAERALHDPEYFRVWCGNMPKHWKPVEAFTDGTELIIMGDPRSDDEEHNCNEMGCSSVNHILVRLTLEQKARTALAELRKG